MKTAYSEEVFNQLLEEKRLYFFELINSIPDTLFDTRNPKEALKRGKKLSSFLANLDEELKAAGVDITPIKKKLEENNIKFGKSMGIPKFAMKLIK